MSDHKDQHQTQEPSADSLNSSLFHSPLLHSLQPSLIPPVALALPRIRHKGSCCTGSKVTHSGHTLEPSLQAD